MTKQSEAEKAAEEYFLSMMEDIPGDIHEVPPKTLHIPIKEMPPLIRNAFLAGAAWAAQQNKQALSSGTMPPFRDEADKADGFIAWHPRHGIDKTSFAAKESLVIAKMEGEWPYEHPLDLGWRIRPVRLVFLDEVDK